MVGKHSNNSVNKQNNRHTLIEFPTRELHIILSAPDLKKLLWGFPGGTVVKNPPANAGDTGDVGLNPGQERSPGGGHSSPLQYSCLKNPMDRRAWWARVLGVTKSQT